MMCCGLQGAAQVAAVQMIEARAAQFQGRPPRLSRGRAR